MVILGVKEILGIKEGAKNGKPWKMVKLLVEEGSTHEEHKASMFVHDNLIPKVGTEIEADMEVTPEGYKNIKKWREIGIKKDLEVFKGTKELPKTPKAPDWDAKELRDFRSRVLAQVSSQLTQTDAEDDVQWADRVIFIAENKFLRYIYDGYNKVENGQEEPF